MKLSTILAVAGTILAGSMAASAANATTVVFPDPGVGSYNYSPAASYDGVTFSATRPAISGVGTSIGADQVNFFDNAFGGHIDVSFAATTSFSAMLSQGFRGTTGRIDVTVLNGASVVSTSTITAGGEDSFTPFSLSGIGQFTQVDFSTAAYGHPEFPGIAQVSVGGVPEPATWAMMLVGFGGLGASMRASRRRAAVA